MQRNARTVQTKRKFEEDPSVRNISEKRPKNQKETIQLSETHGIKKGFLL